MGVTSLNAGDYTGATATYAAGQAFPPVSDGDVYVFGEYEYRYNMRYSSPMWYTQKTQNGWGVKVIRPSTYGLSDIIPVINGRCIKALTQTFLNCPNVDFSGLVIPKTVIYADFAFCYCTKMEKIPDFSKVEGLIDITEMFYGCRSLADITGFSVPASVTNMKNTFNGCTNLTGTIQVNTETVDQYAGCFYATTKPIVLTGTGTEANLEVLNTLAGTANNGNVTVAS